MAKFGLGRSPWWSTWALYAPLAGLGCALAWWQRGAVLQAPVGPRFAQDPSMALTAGLALALAVTAITLLTTRVLVRHTRWARSLHAALRLPLLEARRGELLALAAASAWAEELLFRAALAPLVGVFASALLFGAAHGLLRTTYIGWMVWAGIMGLTFSVLFVGSGSLLPAVLAHALINYGNMRFLRAYDPALPARAPRSLHQASARRL